MAEEAVLNQKEAARLLRMSAPTLRKLLQSPQCPIPHKKIGPRKWLFTRRKLLEYLEQ